MIEEELNYIHEKLKFNNKQGINNDSKLPSGDSSSPSQIKNIK
jgi:hypothetical protein